MAVGQVFFVCGTSIYLLMEVGFDTIYKLAGLAVTPLVIIP